MDTWAGGRRSVLVRTLINYVPVSFSYLDTTLGDEILHRVGKGRAQLGRLGLEYLGTDFKIGLAIGIRKLGRRQLNQR